MLAVGVDAAAVGIAVLQRVAVTGGDAEAQAEVLPERVHICTARSGDVSGAIGRSVVDHENVRVRQLSVQRFEHRWEIVLLVPRRDEDQGVAQRWFLTCRRATVAAASSYTTAPGVGSTRAGWTRT